MEEKFTQHPIAYSAGPWGVLFSRRFRSYQFLGLNTSIYLGNHFEEFVDATIKTGRFKNASEVIRAGLRLLEEENNILSLKNAISKGIETGLSKNFDPKNILKN